MTKLKKILKRFGPGLITGAADDDPSGIGTYVQTGVLFGYGQLWTALFSTPFMIAIQEMSSRISLATGMGIASVIGKNYSKRALYFIVLLLLAVNTINIGADLGAMAASAQLVFGLPIIFWLVAIVALTIALEIFLPYKTYARFLKYLTLFLLAYVATAFVVKQDWSRIIYSTFIPAISFDKKYLLNITAILGTTISPYLFFWQAEEEIEEERARHKTLSLLKETPEEARKGLGSMRFDTALGMIFSNLIMFFIIITAASTLGAHNAGFINTAAEAAEALRPLAGNLTSWIFSLGIIGAGLLAVPVLAGSASYALSEAFGWKTGLNQKLRRARGFYGVIVFSTFIGLLINFIGIPPFKMLYLTAVLNGIIAPILIFILIRVAGNKKIMGEYANSRFSSAMGWIIAGIMSLAIIGLIWNMLIYG